MAKSTLHFHTKFPINKPIRLIKVWFKFKYQSVQFKNVPGEQKNMK